jgi:3-dehydroquinate synthase
MTRTRQSAATMKQERALSVYRQRISVPYEYSVYFTDQVFSVENPHLREAICAREPQRRHRLAVLVEREVAEVTPGLLDRIQAYASAHHRSLALAAEPLLVDGAERCKNDGELVPHLQARFNELGMDRHSFVVVVGGGALQDMAGYAAATTHRGVRVIRVPTTVLAQADSGVGVKNAINAFGKKNFLGTFAPPFAVLNDASFLRTLSRRDQIAGMAEAVKVALIRDAAFFGWLIEHTAELAVCEPEALHFLIHRCAELHLAHIVSSGDPFEFGSARPLDFGHWAAHKLESLTHNNRLRHGEAVAIGIALDSVYSTMAGLLPRTSLEPIVRTLESIGFQLWDEALEAPGEQNRLAILDGLTEFREHLGGELTVTLLEGIGKGVEVHEMREELILEALETLRCRAEAR